MTEYIYGQAGQALGYRRGRFIHDMRGRAIGQVSGDTHIHKLRGAPTWGSSTTAWLLTGTSGTSETLATLATRAMQEILATRETAAAEGAHTGTFSGYSLRIDCPERGTGGTDRLPLARSRSSMPDYLNGPTRATLSRLATRCAEPALHGDRPQRSTAPCALRRRS